MQSIFEHLNDLKWTVTKRKNWHLKIMDFGVNIKSEFSQYEFRNEKNVEISNIFADLLCW